MRHVASSLVLTLPWALAAAAGAWTPTVDASRTPGVSLAPSERPSPGWRCDGFDDQLERAQEALWLEWTLTARARVLEPGRTRTPGTWKVEQEEPPSLESQARSWSEWSGRVVVGITLCPPATLPVEVATQCAPGKRDIRVLESSGDWLIDRTALRAVVERRQALVPPDCRRNVYSLRAVFEPLPPTEVLVPLLVQRLQASDASIRVLAARSLGALGAGAAAALPSLEQAAKDPEQSVRDAVRDAVSRIRQPR